jgi:Ca2+-binding RTX toxin-like protein
VTQSNGGTLDIITDFVTGEDLIEFTIDAVDDDDGVVIDVTSFAVRSNYDNGVASLNGTSTIDDEVQGDGFYDSTEQLLYIDANGDGQINDVRDYTVQVKGTVNFEDLVFVLNGGDGNDSIVAGVNNDTIYSSEGNDTIEAGTGDDYIDASNGTDSIDAGEGNDEIWGGAGDDNINAGDGDDLIIIGAAAEHGASESIAVGKGNDTIRFISTTADETLVLSADVTDDDDFINVEISNEEGEDDGTTALNVDASELTIGVNLKGNAGDNVLTGTSQADTVDGGDGNDTLDFSELSGSVANVGVAINLTGKDISASTINGATLLYVDGDKTAGDLDLGSAAHLGADGQTDWNELRDSVISIESVVATAFVDYIALGAGGMTVTGGAGADVIVLGTGDDTITDLNVNDDIDVLVFSGTETVASNVTSVKHTITVDSKDYDRTYSSKDGFVSFDEDTADAIANPQTLKWNLEEKKLAIQADTTLNASDKVSMFIEGDDAYVYYSGAKGGDDSDDQFVKIEGGKSLNSIDDTDVTGFTLETVTRSVAVTFESNIADFTGANSLSGDSPSHAVSVLAWGGPVFAMWEVMASEPFVPVGMTGANAVDIAAAQTDTVLSAYLTANSGARKLLDSYGTPFEQGVTVTLAAPTGTEDVLIAPDAWATYYPTILLKPFSMTGADGDDMIFGASGNDTLTGGLGNDLLLGGDGVDSIVGDAGDDLIYGGAGNDNITSGEGNDTIYVTSGTDDITDFSNDDILVVSANAQANIVLSEAFVATKDTSNLGTATWSTKGFDVDLSKATGDFTVENTGDGASLIGAAGNDTLKGGTGDDAINGGGGNDSMTGGAGNDTFDITSTAADTDTITDWGNGADTLTGTAFKGQTLNITIDDQSTTALDLSTLLALNGTASVTGGEGNDSINGGASNDTITGGDGDDTITGGNGVDNLAGGDGDDTFVFASGDAFTNGFNPIGANKFIEPAVGDKYEDVNVVNGLITGDTLDLSNASLVIDGGTPDALDDNEFVLVQGDYVDGVFTVGAGLNTGHDSLLIYDANPVVSTIAASFVVLVGVNHTEESSIVNTLGVLTVFGA